MIDTFCGKNCETCAYRENLNCPGCQSGPDRSISAQCELAQCCRTKGHEVCETCGFHDTCRTLRGKDHIPEYRIKKCRMSKIRKQLLQHGLSF